MKGTGGPNGVRVWWPAGLGDLTPAERVEALERGWWRDGDYVVTREGERIPAEEWSE